MPLHLEHHAPTGGIVAAPMTSLAEQLGWVAGETEGPARRRRCEAGS